MLVSRFTSIRADLRDSLVQKAVDRSLAAFDSWGAKRWPVGWIRVRRMGVGWKTILGAVLYYAPDLMSETEKYAPGIASLMGLDQAKVPAIVRGIGTVMFLIGVADKYLKFTRPIERRQGERSVLSENGSVYGVAPIATTTTIPTPLAVGWGYALTLPPPITPEECVVFDNVFAAETTKGESLEMARANALEAVALVQAQAKSTEEP
jgi:hypothetical protein